MDQIKIISQPSESQPFIVLYKPSGIPSAPISPDDANNAFSHAAKLFPQALSVTGRKAIEHGLLHRIDTVTSGLLLIATSQAFYDYLLEEQSAGRFIKYYQAECIDCKDNAGVLKGFPTVDFERRKKVLRGETVCLSSYFRNYGVGQKEVRPVAQDSNTTAIKKIGKQVLYNTEIKLIAPAGVGGDGLTFECKLTAGYRHQVRAHLAWLGFPIIGDSLYNCQEKNLQNLNNDEKSSEIRVNQKIHFTATKLNFTWNGKNFTFQ